MNRFAALRAGYGLLLLLVPGPVIRLYTGHPADTASTTVARLLGGRHLAQALLTLGRPGAMVLALGVQADIAHSGSMLGLAAVDQRRRRGALVDAAAAGSFAVAGAFLAWRRCLAQRASTGPATSTEVDIRRAAAASWIATRTLPAATVRALRVSRPLPDAVFNSPQRPPQTTAGRSGARPAAPITR